MKTIIKLMGEKSGFMGIVLAFFLGSAAAGPLYAAFPVAGVLLKKGSKFSNVLIFIGPWSTTKYRCYCLRPLPGGFYKTIYIGEKCTIILRIFDYNFPYDVWLLFDKYFFWQ